MSDSPGKKTARPKRRRRIPGAPKRRNCEIYERYVLAGETQEQVAAAFGISRQRVGQIAVRVEGWLATHGDHPLAARMRLRSNRRWDAVWSRAIEGFDRSREDREVRKERVKNERVARPATSGEAGRANSGETPLLHEAPLVTFSETVVHQQNGDPRYLGVAMRVAEREDRRWQAAEAAERSAEVAVDPRGINRDRVGQNGAHVEARPATHGKRRSWERLRFRSGRRWDAIFSRAIEGFDRSRKDREIKKERVVRPTTCPPGRSAMSGEAERANSGETPLLHTRSETVVRQQNGDPRYLGIAARVLEREDRRWQVMEPAERSCEVAADPRCAPPPPADRESVALRFPCLPAGLRDLEHLACGLPSPGEDGAPQNGKAIPISMLFEQRCSEAFRYLGLDVRELGQGCGRVADSLAVAALERFAVIIDAKVRRRGYTLGTDDRQFCEYAARHCRELTRSGIERVYFAVVGQGFRQDDLDKLAGFMTGTPIRSVSFIEAAALMRLVNDSIARRGDFRLDQLDRLLFGNKIITEAMIAPETGGFHA